MIKAHPFSVFRWERDAHRQRRSIFPLNSEIIIAFFKNDEAFNWMYQQHFQLRCPKRWMPPAIARKSALFLANYGAKVLGIGSGISKCCFALVNNSYSRALKMRIKE